LICSLLKEHLAFSTETEKDDVDLLKKILTFIYENYQGDVSRKTIAKTLGYTEGYISHVFHRYLKISISSFSNVLRLKHVDDMIKNGDNRPISTLLYQAGFKSEQTYYRVKANFKR
jgi:AraC-like DNA-binding protein